MSRCVMVIGQPTMRTNISVNEMSFEDLAVWCIRSLWKNAPPDRLLVYWNGEGLQERIQDLGPTTFAEMPEGVLAEGYDAYKILMADRTIFKPGEEVILLDLDTLVTGNIWDAFDWNFDIAVPSRVYWLSTYPINMGLVAMRWTEMTKLFVHDWVSNILNPQFVPYQEMRENPTTARIMCRDEDYLNALVRGANLKGLYFIILPPEFNWFPWDDMVDQVGFARVGYEHGLAQGARMLHFKGENKVLMPEFAERIHVAV